MTDCSAIFLQFYNFCIILKVKSGDVSWPKMPQKLKLYSDFNFAGMAEDPIKYLLLKNIMSSLASMPNQEQWHGAREKFDIFFDLLINARSICGNTIVDLIASLGALLQASGLLIATSLA